MNAMQWIGVHVCVDVCEEGVCVSVSVCNYTVINISACIRICQCVHECVDVKMPTNPIMVYDNIYKFQHNYICS